MHGPGWQRLAARLAAGLAFGALAPAGQAAELADLSLEQLREVVVTTVSRRAEPLERAAAAVYVISRDDIRRSGATTLPEALRLAPQLHVARADANQYAISARGFNNVLANNLLVLIDGRAVYTPLFSGVFWEAQDVMLEDVERIEVVSGPSTALWGTNAVNGLIHVITRRAADTAGPAAAAHAGNRERGAAARWGGRAGEALSYRLYAKSYDRSATHQADGRSVHDEADGLQAGFRADWAAGTERATVQGDLYQGGIDQPGAAGGRRFSGANLLGRWQRSLHDSGRVLVQLYADHTERMQPGVFDERLDTLDAVAQYEFGIRGTHRVVLGGGWRHADDRTGHGAALAFRPENSTMDWTRVFAQDQLALGEHSELGLSASVEHNPYTGFEILPSVRLAHRTRSGTWWGALSRSVRAPSRIDRELFQPAEPPFVLAGGPAFRAEVSRVAELGYRGQPDPTLSYALTLFHHQHERLRSVGRVGSSLQVLNDIEGRSTGVEAWASWRPASRWRLSTGGVLLHRKLHVVAGAQDFGGLAGLGDDPTHWWKLRSSLDLTPRLAWDVSLRRVGALPEPAVPAYTALDMRLAWSLHPDLELALVLRNLGDPQHPEWGTPANRVELERSAGLQLRWRL